ncbi:lipoprotein LpqV [Candidatus Mycolicibacterium alkanivorans]|uniref:Lipoprotein LpqV n=1 Tax=Candidatus Mycolicibacterium alkanivorans TaxID=2954114 RepID=A0ABS9YUL8_9MYCO|nr:lipoprotein LpqV [Candidatus Mycolicibacterium alkanivorans]MCI4674813.1 lipoprotein LpqV [Candidatus Mycolicibacterium alkanivorans]
MVVTAATAALIACSSGGGGHATSGAPAPSSRAQQSVEEGKPSEPIGVSAGGVTTRIDVPAESTEEQYAQACVAAKKWIESQGGDPATLVEPMLKELQAGTEPGPATFNSTWAQLSTAQQAAVIIAVRAAAQAGC